jgi:hypothetical protein
MAADERISGARPRGGRASRKHAEALGGRECAGAAWPLTSRCAGPGRRPHASAGTRWRN